MIKQVLAAAMLAIATPAFAQITVTGKGTVSAEPDMATVTLGVVCEDASSTVASDKMNKQMNAVLDKLKELKLAEKDICTTGYNLSPKYVYPKDNNGEAKMVGFTASTSIHVKVRDLSKLGSVLESSVKSGATNVGAVRFEVTDTAALLNKARELATDEAKKKAKLYADNLGIKVGSVKSVAEHETRASSMYDSGIRSASADAPRLQAGERSYSIEVTVVFDTDHATHGKNHPKKGPPPRPHPKK